MTSTYTHEASLAGKSVIVTGAAQGIGRGIAQILCERGASVLLTDINEEKLSAVHTELAALGYAVTSIAGNIADVETATAVIDAAVGAFGHLDGLVNNAVAGNPPTPFTDLTDADYERVFTSGPQATFRLMQLAYPLLKAQGGGSIVNMGSGAGASGVPLFGAYGGAKEAIRGISKVAAAEWGKDQIRVNCVCPAAFTEGAAWWKQMDPAAFEAGLAGTPLGRMGDVLTDVAPVIAFLLGDDSAYLTGQTLFVDGGAGSIR